MTISTDISRRFWNLPQKPGEELSREKTFIDDIIMSYHLSKIFIMRHTANRRTIHPRQLRVKLVRSPFIKLILA
jgi:hypothetical protein